MTNQVGLTANAEQMVETEAGFDAVMRILVTKDIMRHREIPLREIAEHLQLTTTYVGGALSGRLFLKKPYSFEAMMDRIDLAITDICDIRGYECTCSPEGRLAMAVELARDRAGYDALMRS